MDLRKSAREKKPRKLDGIYNYYSDLMIDENDQNETDNDESYKPFSLSKRNKKKRRNLRLKPQIDYNDGDDDVETSEVSDQEFENILRKKLTKTKKTNSLKRNAIKKKNNAKESELVFLLKWRQNIHLSSTSYDDKYMKLLEIEKIYKADLSKYAEDIQALFINFTGYPFCQNEMKLKRLQELDINKKLMKNGIVFLWSEIEILQDLMKIMEKKNFKYIEHFTIVHLKTKRALSYLDENELKTYQSLHKEEQSLKIKDKLDENSEDFNDTESSDLQSNRQQEFSSHDFLLNRMSLKKHVKALEMFSNKEEEDFFFRRSKNVLLMFRRFDLKNCQLELRHQRTCDVLFDLVDENEEFLNSMKTKEYIYKMIETLLPKANINVKDNIQKKPNLKMMEIWANDAKPRLGWIKIRDTEKLEAPKVFTKLKAETKRKNMEQKKKFIHKNINKKIQKKIRA